MAHEKQYGLILPGSKVPPKAPATASKPKNVFGDADSSDDENAVDWVRQSLKKQSHGSMQQKQSLQVMKKALEDDPSVYEYDEVYDEMERKKEEAKKKEKGTKKPKYIEGLLKTAKQRDLENELRRERLAQKEREDEGDEFDDKEAFVTAAYKKKMEDIRKMQEDQAHLDAVDDITEVTKQKDMSGFYRYLYREKMKEETDPSKDSKTEETDPSKNSKIEETKSLETVIKQEIADPEENVEKMIAARSPVPRGSRESSLTSERRPETRNRRSNSPDTDRRKEKRGDPRQQVDSARRKRPRSRSENRRRRESPHKRRNDHEKDRRDRSRSRDRGNKNRYDRHRRSRSTDRDRNRRQDSRSGRGSENDWPSDRNRYFTQDERTKDRSKRDQHQSNKDQNSKASTSASKDGKIKIIQKENWYDFDVEIEREVNKDFYSKRTVGKAFDEALQRYLVRKGPDQQLDPKSKYT